MLRVLSLSCCSRANRADNTPVRQSSDREARLRSLALGYMHMHLHAEPSSLAGYGCNSASSNITTPNFAPWWIDLRIRSTTQVRSDSRICNMSHRDRAAGKAWARSRCSVETSRAVKELIHCGNHTTVALEMWTDTAVAQMS